ncbi:PIN domain-containing protein [Nitrosomonas oligotropha]|uniref:Ribonuclease VapC n=1 Tax=Nitrosomonas oligotropha TaxID=42354 RepID=A0A1H8UJ43_9PROT|nr:PIN domain-containing protein [Nitrosomonas oligotropha]SDX47207.1 Predicted nucleic acid-binding protein, contains PIN domain [Nitrosomonas oligotropha]SEP03037.1 Predicted nucleic acid-binding protein, contains PIN domain [Nitrosomonas oligotropha]
MSGDFIDTNIFIYLFDETDDRKRAISEQLIQQALETRNACISYQVIQETLNVVTRKLPSPMSTENARRFLEQILIPLWQTMPSLALYQQGLELQARYGFSFYDALIVAAALESGCTRLYTEDLQHGQQVGELLIENPFRE